MELFLVRHAIALDAEPSQADDIRPLSEQGTARFKDVVRGLERLEVRLDCIYHSPKLRAVQTANLLAKLLKGRLVMTNNLAEPPSPALLKEISGSRVAVVGHEPWISALCAWLVIGEPRGGPFPFKKGGVAHLEGNLQAGQMRLLAMYPPKVWRVGSRSSRS